jgi:hypothetical protein
MSLYRNDFYIEDGMAIQANNLRSWKVRLNKRCYDLVAAECKRQNALPGKKTGYDVYRGNSIDTFIHNIK